MRDSVTRATGGAVTTGRALAVGLGVAAGIGETTADDTVGAGEAVGAAIEAGGGIGIELMLAVGPQLATSAPARPSATDALSLPRPTRSRRGDGSIDDLVGRFEPDGAAFLQWCRP